MDTDGREWSADGRGWTQMGGNGPQMAQMDAGGSAAEAQMNEGDGWKARWTRWRRRLRPKRGSVDPEALLLKAADLAGRGERDAPDTAACAARVMDAICDEEDPRGKRDDLELR